MRPDLDHFPEVQQAELVCVRNTVIHECHGERFIDLPSASNIEAGR